MTQLLNGHRYWDAYGYEGKNNQNRVAAPVYDVMEINVVDERVEEKDVHTVLP